MLSDEKDARAFRGGVGAIEALLDTDAQVVVQHAPNHKGSPLCGATGAVLTGIVIASSISCDMCRAKFKPRGRRAR